MHMKGHQHGCWLHTMGGDCKQLNTNTYAMTQNGHVSSDLMQGPVLNRSDDKHNDPHIQVTQLPTTLQFSTAPTDPGSPQAAA
jgi:hypothetical protein